MNAVWILIMTFQLPNGTDVNAFLAAYRTQTPCLEAIQLTKDKGIPTPGVDCVLVPIYDTNKK